MAYLRCESCGAKALVAASRCPRCAHAFQLLDARGERAALKQCRGCGIMHRRDRACAWCPPSARRPSPIVAQVLAAALVLSLVGAGSWHFGPSLTAPVREIVRPATPAAAKNLSALAPSAMPNALSAPSSAMPDPATAVVAQDSAMAHADSVTWVPAVARTWVNVRRDASRGGDVVGVIKPASRAMLGTGRSGWRQVRSEQTTGWVDPKLFVADSLGMRG